MAEAAAALERLLGASLPQQPGGRRDDLLVAAAAAVAGGKETLAWFGREALEVREKEAGDPVTAADHASNGAILSVLGDRCPEDGIVSEETVPPGRAGADGDPGTGRVWVVDPLDGTRYFIDGRGEFAAMVGLAEDGRAVAGAVYRPDRDVLYVGGLPDGCWRVADVTGEPEAARLRIAGEPGRPLRFVESLAHPVAGIDRLERELAEVQVLLAGSVGIKCAMIAEGEADLYVHPVPYLGEWDTCAPEAILQAAGGRVTDCAGDPLRYGKPVPRQPGGLFAARADVWERVAPTVRSVGGALLAEQRP